MNSYIMFEKFKLQEAKQAKKVTVDIGMDGKTRLRLSMQYAETRVGVNMLPDASSHLRFHEENKMSYFDGERHLTRQLVFSKKQNFPVMIQHIKNIVCHVFQIQESDEFTVEIPMNRHYSFIQQRYP